MKAKLLVLGPGGEVPYSYLKELLAGLRRGALVVFPTDTVYGIGTDALSPRGPAALFEAKGRSPLKPLPFLIESLSRARRWADWTPEAERLANRFWPGPLTLILQPTPEGQAIAGAPGIGLRVPRHRAVLTILGELGGPLASSSANRSGEAACVQAEEVLERFGGTADFMLIQEEPLAGVESTVADLTFHPPAVLRPGAISPQELFRTLE